MIWLIAAAFADDLGLDRVLSSVEQHHPALLAELQRVASAEADVLSARGAFDPTLKEKTTWTPVGDYPSVRNQAWVEAPTALYGATLSAGHDVGIGKFPDYKGDYETGDLGEVWAQVDVPLLKDGPIDRRRQTVRRANLEITNAEAGVLARRLELRRAAAQRYWDWVAAGQRLRIAENLLTLADSRDRQLVARVAAGDLAEFDRQDNQRLVYQRTARKIEAERSFQKSQLDLSLFLRGDDGAPLLAPITQVPASLPSIPAPEANPVPTRPELARLDAARRQAELDRRLAQNQVLPGLNLVVGATGDLAGEALPELDAGVVASWPAPMRAARGRIRSAEAALNRIAQETRLQNDRIVQEIADATSALRAATARVDAISAEAELSKTLEEGERKRFTLGDSNLIFVNTREIATADAEAQRITAIADGWKAWADLEAAIGRLP
jgi:cobalt-zinc-cadmium efflux system outer membrane protein